MRMYLLWKTSQGKSKNGKPKDFHLKFVFIPKKHRFYLSTSDVFFVVVVAFLCCCCCCCFFFYFCKQNVILNSQASLQKW